MICGGRGMEYTKYVILGAGPAGLAFAQGLKDQGQDSFVILEKEKTAGGLCRSACVDGSPFDIGGGHFLDVRRPGVVRLLFRFLPQEEWQLYERDSRIRFRDMTIGHPFEANIWQMDMESQISYLISIAAAGCSRGLPAPEHFVDWIRWKLGERIAEDYMLPYNRKMFADELDELGTYWLDKLPDVSFEETLRSCLCRRPYGTQPGHASFYYPKKYGYGEVWLRMAGAMKEHILYEKQVCGIDFDSRQVWTMSGESYGAEKIITTVPWAEFGQIKGMPEELESNLRRLKHSSVETRYVAQELDTQAHWIYEPAPEIPWHRILVRHNFCPGSRGYWVETRKERTAGGDGDSFRYMNEYAYPLNTVDKPEIMEGLLHFGRSRGVYGLGRWGEHSHYNSDVVVELAMKLAKELL